MAGILLNRSRQVPAEETPAFGGIAERFRRAGDLDRAIGLCRDGLKKFPDQLSARVTLGWSLLDKGQYDEARAELERVLRRAPDNLAAIRGLAELHDRSEGAMPSMDDHREAWRTDEMPSPDAGEPAGAPSAASSLQAPPASEDPFAPISVTFSHSSSATPEIVHTAEGAGRAAQEAAALAAAMALLGSDRVEVEEPASATMSASVDFEVTPFETGIDATLALDEEPSAGSAFELETAADNLLAASAADDGRPRQGFAAVESDLAETEELVASLQQFSVDEPAPAADLVLEMPGTGESDLAGLVAFEASSTAEGAPALDNALMGGELDAPLAAMFEDGPSVALESPEARAAFHVDTALDASMAALAESDELESLTTSIADESEVRAPMTLEASEDDLADEVGVAAAPLSDIPEVAPEPAFVPDLAFALGRVDQEPSPEPSNLSETAIAETDEPQLAVGAADPEFTPDLSGMVLEGHGFDALVASPVVLDSSAPDVLAFADLAEQEPEFVPDLSAVALDGSAPDVLAAPVVVHHEVSEVSEAPVPVRGDHAEPAFVPDLTYAFDMAEGQAVAREEEDADDLRVSVAAIAQPRPGVRALERFLRQVESRKLQLGQGSVA
ncbi:MAG: tetratricopeptide repeat protein [Acidobacteriota bacterium]